MNDRLMIAAMALQGMLAGGVNIHSESALAANRSLQFADALLAAAGEQEEPQREGGCACRGFYNSEMPTTVCGYHEELYAKLAACERERDGYKFDSDGYRKLTNFLSENSDGFDRYYTIGDFTWDAAIAVIKGQASEIADLKRRLEPLTRDELVEDGEARAYWCGMTVTNVLELTKQIDRIRARRA